MCGRYYIELDEQDIETLVNISKAIAAEEKAKAYGEICPSDTAYVIACNRNMQQRLFPMKWGFPREDKKLLMINARSESALEKPAFAQSAKHRRCVIPASGYYEWGHKDIQTGKKPKYAFTNPNDKLIFMAGLYMLDEKTRKPYYTILTRDAAPGIAMIHNRMPVILPRNKLDEWLSPDADYESVIKSAWLDVECRAV